MRISDWSSGVCSSDLQFLQRLQLGGAAEHRVGHLAGDAAVGNFQAIGARLVEAAGGANALGEAGEAAGHQRAVGAASAHGGDQGACAGRSEEHTSELQSLMRISYAVFCLKKKNKVQ